MFIAIVALRMPAFSSSSVGLFAFQVLVHDHVVGVSYRLDQHVASSLCRFEQRSRNLFNRVLRAPLSSSCQRIAFIVTRSITPRNFASAPIWMLIGIGARTKTIDNRRSGIDRIRAGPYPSC